MIPTKICFFCCLIVAAFVLRLVVVAAIRLAGKNEGKPPCFPRVFSAVAGLAFFVAAVQIGTAVLEMRALYKIGEVATIGESKDRVEEFVTPSFREIVSPGKRAAAKSRNTPNTPKRRYWQLATLELATLPHRQHSSKNPQR